MAFSFARNPVLWSGVAVAIDGQPLPELCSIDEPVDHIVPGIEAWNASFDAVAEEAVESLALEPEDDLKPIPAKLLAAWPQGTRKSVIQSRAKPVDIALRKDGAKRGLSDGEGSDEDKDVSEVDEAKVKKPARKKTAATKKAAAPKKTAAPKPPRASGPPASAAGLAAGLAAVKQKKQTSLLGFWK